MLFYVCKFSSYVLMYFTDVLFSRLFVCVYWALLCVLCTLYVTIFSPEVSEILIGLAWSSDGESKKLIHNLVHKPL
jgi:hypothetical protein